MIAAMLVGCAGGEPVCVPGTELPCDGIDGDCDGRPDPVSWCADHDGDGYGVPTSTCDGTVVANCIDGHETPDCSVPIGTNPCRSDDGGNACDGVDSDGTVDFCRCATSLPCPEWRLPAGSETADLDGDGVSNDVLTHGAGRTVVALDMVSAGAPRAVFEVPDESTCVADFEGDGVNDILAAGWWYPSPVAASTPVERRYLDDAPTCADLDPTPGIEAFVDNDSFVAIYRVVDDDVTPLHLWEDWQNNFPEETHRFYGRIVGDVTGDQYAEYVVVDSFAGGRMYGADGYCPVYIPCCWGPAAVGDLDGDGFVDAIWPSYPDVEVEYGPPCEENRRAATVIGWPNGLGDLDGDGGQELSFSGTTALFSHPFGWLPEGADWAEHATGAVMPDITQAGDVDGDGEPDFAYPSADENGPFTAVIRRRDLVALLPP